MDLFAEQHALEPLSARAEAGDAGAAIELAWYLRQADTTRASSLLARGPVLALAGGGDALAGRAALVRAEAAAHFVQLDEAAARLDEARRLLAGDPEGRCDAAMVEMVIASARGQPQAALASAERAAAEAQADPARADIALAHAAMLAVYAQPEAAVERLEALEARTLGTAAAVAAGMARSLHAFNRGDHGAVVRTLEPLAPHADRLGMLQARLRIGNTIAAAYSNLDDKETAISWVEGSIERARAARWPIAVGEALAFLGNFYREAGHVERALETLREARDTLSIAPRSRGYALACCYLAHAQLAAGNAAAAHEHAREAEVAARAINAIPIVADVLTVAAQSRARTGDPREGAGMAQQALALAREHGLGVWEIDALRALAGIHADPSVPPPPGVGPAAAPLHFLELARAAVDRQAGHAERVNILRELARAYEAAGDLARALEAERAALAHALSEETRRVTNRLAAVEARHQVERQRLDVERQREVAAAHAARADALDAANAKLRAAQADLERLANTDPLTGVPNRRHFFAAAEAEVERCLRYGRSVGLVMGDIDRFKAINDTHGHPAGDRVIVAAAQALDAAKRSIDGLGRLGGEEFALLLPEADLATVLAAAERMRRAVEGASAEFEGHRIGFTMSFGAAALEGGPGGVPARALEDLVRRADAALYEAKAAGRNRVGGVPA